MGTGKQIAEYARGAYDVQGGYIFGTQGTEWTAAKQASMESNKADNPDYAESIKYGKKWIGHKVWDCSGLTRQAALKAGASIHHGSNSTYLYDVSHKGEMTDDIRLPEGAFVFTGTTAKKPHIGTVTGEDEVTEASCARLGVIKSKVHKDKWKFWGLCKGVEFDFIPKPGEKRPTLKKGSTGVYVTLLQTKLIQKGYSCGSAGADGKFGSGTEKAVQEFQRANGLEPDGIVGPKTWAALDETGIRMYTVTIPHLAEHHAKALVDNYEGATMKEEE